jgi:serine/threonine protein kinase
MAVMSDAEEKKDKRREEKEVSPTASFGVEGRGPGGKIGQFRIESELGRGGMGVVYLAHDTKLNRQVAIKNLPPELIANPDVRSRFSREARILASLNHPNIATIYEELEEGEGASYLVLEYVPGDTLSERIVPGGLKLEETLSFALQIAEAVAAAHEKGIIHRDLKPGNIKITPEGKVKVLDFGIARTVSSEPIAQRSTVTELGRIIGTPAYMSPEQVRGQEVDRRSDIWSFGCVLYEMLTGRVPFEGETGSDTLAGILEREPEWHALPKNTPTNIQILLRRCLEKDRRRRLQHIGDAAIEIRETLNVPAVAPPMVTLPEGISRPAGLRRPMVCGAICLLFGAIAAVVVTYILMKPTAGPSLHIPESLPPDKMLNQDRSEIALSPDGKLLVYVGGVGNATRLFLSEVGKNEEVKELQETKGARLPFFSPKSNRIGFFADGKLKTLFLEGGRPHPLCDAPHYAGGSWRDDNTIFFSPTWIKGGLRQIPADADERVAEVITTPEPNNGEFGHWWPEVLPGGEAVLFTIWKTTLNDAQVAVLTLKTGKIEILINGATHARYASTGHLLYAQSGTLMAAPFDLNKLKLKVGEPKFVVAKGLKQHPANGYAPFCFSKDFGVAYYVRGGEWLAKRQFVWVNRETRAVEPLSLDLSAYSYPCLHPDGLRFAYTKFDRSDFNIWIYDFVSKIPQQLTSESSNFLPFWTPDSSKLTFTTYREGPFSVYWMPADGSSAEKPLVTGILDREAFSWSPDGKKLLFVETDPCTGEDIWIYSIEDGNTTRPLLYGTSNEREAVFSPDGDWIAYVSEEEKDRPEVYVTPYPKLAPEKISTDGGCQPLWSQDSNELFYRSGDKMMDATFETEPDFRVTSRVLFEGQYLTGMYRNYDVSKDGQRFLMIKEAEAQPGAAQLMFVYKKRLVPTGKD